MAYDKPVVSIVLGSYNRFPYLQGAINSVRTNGLREPYDIIVVDGGSTDGSIDWLIQQKDVITILQHNRGEFKGRPIQRRSWGYFMNLAFRAAHGTYVVMISDDCLILPGTISCAIDCMQMRTETGRQVGAVAFYYRDWPTDREYYVQLTLGGKLMVNHGMFLRQALEEVGWADEDRYRFYKADGDLCLRLWEADYEILDCEGAYVEHHAHANTAVRQSNTEMLDHDRTAYLERWKGIYYHPGEPDRRGRRTASFVDLNRTAERAWGRSS